MIEQWYNTVFHELVHSTGHPTRLDRLAAENWSREIHAYGREELVAGMGSAMLSSRAGLEQETILMDAAYVKHWSEAIRGDKTIVVRAAGLAQRAVDFITGETYGEEPEKKTEEKETRELQPAWKTHRKTLQPGARPHGTWKTRPGHSLGGRRCDISGTGRHVRHELQ